jgi:hypothetical protein
VVRRPAINLITGDNAVNTSSRPPWHNDADLHDHGQSCRCSTQRALGNLTISTGTLAPAFSSNVLNYTDAVANATA